VFTLTPLLDGTVLAADYGQTDLYNPSSGTFSLTAPLPTDIDAISAVRLTDGRVLAVGGVRGSTTASEIYVPATRTWQAAASLNYDHIYAPWNEVLLADGRVLIVGGFSCCGYAPPFGELWDPASRPAAPASPSPSCALSWCSPPLSGTVSATRSAPATAPDYCPSPCCAAARSASTPPARPWPAAVARLCSWAGSWRSCGRSGRSRPAPHTCATGRSSPSTPYGRRQQL
jgi:hypothetical protein